MNHYLLTLATALTMMGAATNQVNAMEASRTNPFMAPYDTPYEIPPFDRISYDDYLPALKAGIAEQKKAVEAIVNNPEAPTFENTIVALDHSGPLLERVCLVFMALDESNSTPEMTAIGEEFYPLYSAHSDEISMNEKLFARIKTLYDNRDKMNYTKSQRLAIEKSYKDMVRNGALLNDADKAELKAINSRLSDLYLKFNKNLLTATNAFELVVDDKAKLSGLPETSIAVAAEEAAKRNMKGKWVFTLHAPSRLPLLQYADNRELREKMYKGYTTLASSGEYNNYPVIAEILKARIRKANILGFKNYADYMTDNVMAKKLYGVTFTEIPDAPKYDPEVKVYDVTDADGKHVAVFMTDYYTRPSKRQGAWMSEFKGSFVTDDGKAERPIVYNVANFTRPTGNTPCLLSLDEVETMFHEFGHGLHGMLTRAKYKSQAGTNVDRDFVELPSQIHEHWAMEPELLKTYAHHYKTGEVIPDELIKKLDEASTHNQGFITTELVGAALLDLQWGQLTDADNVDVESFEKNVADKLSMPSQVAYRYRSPYFKHIFGSDGYASGYYTYLWAEVLDADGFELFKEKGIFDPATAKSFKENVLEAGGSDDPMELYVKFRGKKPTPEALLRNRGLINEPAKPGNLPMPGGK